MSTFKIYNGDCLEILRNAPDNFVDSICCDPPYGLSFMSKKWDYDVPTVEIWKECLRVLKPGGHLLAFGGTRTYHRLVVAIEDAGFEIRDQIQWLYGQGFPKSQNLAKAAGDESLAGLGTALKPANEPICLARKPLSESTIAKNVIKHGTGGINIKASRIEFTSEKDKASVLDPMTGEKGYEPTAGAMTGGIKRMDAGSPDGRFPSNVILDEDAAQVLDEQSGILKSGELRGYTIPGASPNGHLQGKNPRVVEKSTASIGGASRFFYVAKASKAERNYGCEGLPVVECGVGDDRPSGQSMQRLDGRETRAMQNTHPTVKPIKLMEYLIKLVTPEGGIVLDPFMGSGTTGVAALRNGFQFRGIEREENYFNICQSRLDKETV